MKTEQNLKFELRYDAEFEEVRDEKMISSPVLVGSCGMVGDPPLRRDNGKDSMRYWGQKSSSEQEIKNTPPGHEISSDRSQATLTLKNFRRRRSAEVLLTREKTVLVRSRSLEPEPEVFLGSAVPEL